MEPERDALWSRGDRQRRPPLHARPRQRSLPLRSSGVHRKSRTRLTSRSPRYKGNHNKKEKLDLAFHGGSFKNSLAEAASARRMSRLGAGEHAAASPGPSRQGGARPHLRSICFILNWYQGPRLQLTKSTVTPIEIPPLKIDALGVAQSEYHILLLNEPLIP